MVIKKKRVLIPLHKRFDFSSFEKPIWLFVSMNWDLIVSGVGSSVADVLEVGMYKESG